MYNVNLIRYYLTILSSERNIKFRNENIYLKLLIKDQMSKISNRKKDIILPNIPFFHIILQVDMFKILPSNLLFLHSKILTTFNHQNILSLNQNIHFVVIQVMVLSLDMMMFACIINLIKIIIFVQIFMVHIQIQQKKEISFSLKILIF
jgi:hypothetical protein